MSGKIPESWFDDDPEWQLLRSRAEGRSFDRDLRQRMKRSRTSADRAVKSDQTAPRPAPAVKKDQPDEVTLNFKISLPRISLPKFGELYHQNKSLIIKATVITMCFGLLIGGAYTYSWWSASSDSGKTLAGVSGGQASFEPLMPIDSLAGETEPEVRYDVQKHTYNYSSELNGAILTVSQQALPENFKNNPNELAYIAKQIRADNQIETQKGNLHIATDEESKTQTAIFSSKQVLVFIRSNKKLDNEEWKLFVNQLN